MTDQALKTCDWSEARTRRKFFQSSTAVALKTARFCWASWKWATKTFPSEIFTNRNNRSVVTNFSFAERFCRWTAKTNFRSTWWSSCWSLRRQPKNEFCSTSTRRTSIRLRELTDFYTRFPSKICRRATFSDCAINAFPHPGFIITSSAWEACTTRRNSASHWTIYFLESRA